MKKRKKTMTTLLVLLMVLLGGYYVIEEIQQKQKEKADSAADTEINYITELSDVTALKYSDGENELSFVKKEDVWYYEADETLDLEESEIEYISSVFAAVVAVRTLEEPDALEDYGLETPVYTVEIQDASGNEAALYIGNEVDSGYYVTVGDKEMVYTVSSSVVSAMQWDVEELLHVEELEETVEEITEEAAEEIIEE